MENKQNDAMRSGQVSGTDYTTANVEVDEDIFQNEEPTRAAGPMMAGSNYGMGGLRGGFELGLGGPDLLGAGSHKGTTKQPPAQIQPSRALKQDVATAEILQPKTMASEYMGHDTIEINHNALNMTPKAVEEVVLQILRSLRVRFKRKDREFRSTGSYVLNEEIVDFEMQLWILASGNIGVEFRRKGTVGRQAYREVINKVAYSLKEKKMAKKFANQRDILKPISEIEKELQDLGQELFGFGPEDEKEDSDLDSEFEDIPGPPPMPFSFLGCPTAIRLNDEAEILSIWFNILKSENLNHVLDTLKVLVRASRNSDNAKVLARNRNILNAILEQLNQLVSAQVLHSVSELLCNIAATGEAAALEYMTSTPKVLTSLMNVAYTFVGQHGSTVGLDNSKKKKIKKMQANAVVAQNAVTALNLILTNSSTKVSDEMTARLQDMLQIVSTKTAGDTELEASLKKLKDVLAVSA